MDHRALIVEDDPDIAESVAEKLDSLGHEHTWAKSQEEARLQIGGGGFTYVLLDLQIPTREGAGLPLVEYGKHLAREIHDCPAMKGVPIIAMTAHGKEAWGIAAPLFDYGVVQTIDKPFPTGAYGLGFIIESVLQRAYREVDREPKTLKPEKPFQGGELRLCHDRVELCGVTVLASGKSSQMWSVLHILKQRLDNGRYRAFPGSALAGKGGQGGVAGSIRDFRRYVAEQLGRELGLKLDRDDVIETSSAGYRLNNWIEIKDLEAGANPSKAISATPRTLMSVRTDADGHQRRARIMELIQSGKRLRVPDFAAMLHCSYSTAKREVDALKSEGQVTFMGPAKTGYYQLVLTE